MSRNFDYSFYVNYYKDLRNITQRQAYHHWTTYGKKEGRVATLEEHKEYKMFNHHFYVNHYDDLRKKNWNKQQAFWHWLVYGKEKEGRENDPVKYYSNTKFQKEKSIAFIIPGTSHKRAWNDVNESDLYKIFLPTLIPILDKQYKFKIFFGIDKGDIIYDNTDNQLVIKNYIKDTNLEIDFIYMDIEKGYLSMMWNKLFQIAYDEGFDYFYQCGDDISFSDKNMFHTCVSILDGKDNIGLTGPYTTNGNVDILTQSFVSRKHMDIFGFYFPPEIKNWYIDDWITGVYSPHLFYPIKSIKISNDGGSERYTIEKVIDWQKIVDKYKWKINKFCQRNV